jgi:hypothetical protein
MMSRLDDGSPHSAVISTTWAATPNSTTFISNLLERYKVHEYMSNLFELSFDIAGQPDTNADDSGVLRVKFNL